MKSIFETEINVPRAKLAEFYANPQNNVKWMEDLERSEYISGELGMPGSKYRFIPKKGTMVFTATVITRDIPNELQLILESPTVDVLVTAKFIVLSPEKTKFISEEVFTFKGFFNKAFGFLAKGAVTKAHHKHMEDFKKVVTSTFR
jgi:hypothetical protein